MSKIIITNNPLVHENVKEDKIVYLKDKTLLDVLVFARDKVHQGHKLLTHPLSGSIKPNETPYKTLLISSERNILDFDSLDFIEQSIVSAKKFLCIQKPRIISDKINKDFQIIDYSIMSHLIK